MKVGWEKAWEDYFGDWWRPRDIGTEKRDSMGVERKLEGMRKNCHIDVICYIIFSVFRISSLIHQGNEFGIIFVICSGDFFVGLSWHLTCYLVQNVRFLANFLTEAGIIKKRSQVNLICHQWFELDALAVKCAYSFNSRFIL